MINQIEATYQGQVIYPHEPLKLKPYVVRAQTQVVKMRLALRKKKVVTPTEASPKPQENIDLPEALDHYLFW